VRTANSYHRLDRQYSYYRHLFSLCWMLFIR